MITEPAALDLRSFTSLWQRSRRLMLIAGVISGLSTMTWYFPLNFAKACHTVVAPTQILLTCWCMDVKRFVEWNPERYLDSQQPFDHCQQPIDTSPSSTHFLPRGRLCNRSQEALHFTPCVSQRRSPETCPCLSRWEDIYKCTTITRLFLGFKIPESLLVWKGAR